MMDPVTVLLGLGANLIEKLFPDPAQAAQAKLQLLTLQQTGELAKMTAQTDTDKVEAANPSIFVSGWRPFIGWVCGSACAWNWIGIPIVNFGAKLAGHPVDISPADISQMMPVLFGMLGLGSLRTVEKINGVAAK